MADLLLMWKPQGARVNMLTKANSNALGHAACHGHLEMAKLLVRSGANVNNRNTEGETAFFPAAHPDPRVSMYMGKYAVGWTLGLTGKRMAVMEFFLQAGADPNTVNVRGGDALAHSDMTLEKLSGASSLSGPSL